MELKEKSLIYHSSPVKGKIEVIPSKPCRTQDDLSCAYTPGVAYPCLEIKENKALVSEYTNKSNLVGVITNGTAVLGLGNIGPEAGKPVMEGKGVLFKRFADVDVFDIELDCNDPQKFIDAVKIMGPTFGGINLEDIKAPECFEIEDSLKALMDIPVFHDDQHGTAIITGAALLNALEISGKKIDEVKVVINGAGAAGIACGKFYIALGIRKENITMCDTKGIIYKGRQAGMNKYKEYFASGDRPGTLADAMKGADIFLGLSGKGLVSGEMLRTMNDNPVVFALANPDPEITYPEAVDAREDVIMATGRSDYPNQVNNVMGFPFIFRGALDVEASCINEEMKIAASKALASLAKLPVPEEVLKAYNKESLSFGKDYIIPKPFDPRVFVSVSSAVAEAAVASGVARSPYKSKEEYISYLEERMKNSISRFRSM